jgi:hypothetical protein
LDGEELITILEILGNSDAAAKDLKVGDIIIEAAG